MTDDVRLLNADTEGLSHRFEMRLDGAPVRRRVDEELRKHARSASLPGFRPGKVPLSMLRQRFGQRLREAVVDRMAIAVARDLIAQRSLQPIGRPSIHIVEDTDAAVTFMLVLEVAPQFQLGDVGGYQLERLHSDPPDDELEQESELLLRRELFDAMMKRYHFPVPSGMVDSEYGRIVRGFEDEVGEAPDEELAAELRHIAERRIRLAIVLTEIGNTSGVSVPRGEIAALIQQQAELEPDHEAEIVSYYLDHPTALAELQSPLFEDRVVNFVLAKSHIDELTVSADELRTRLEAG